MEHLFLSTLSLRRATRADIRNMRSVSNFYPRSPCGERQAANSLADTPPQISIHALLAESDYRINARYTKRVISIHALLAESDISALWMALNRPLFLSTLSLRRATSLLRFRFFVFVISIHALLAESDFDTMKIVVVIVQFLSTLSLRRATTWTRGSRVTYVISIHALLAESDRSFFKRLFGIHISIHALLAESDYLTKYHFTGIFIFLSTLSLRRATDTGGNDNGNAKISIHALLAESDLYPRSWLRLAGFLSTLSLRRATRSLLS